MKKIIQKIKQNIGEIMVIIGSGIFVYNVFNFSHCSYNFIGKISDVKYYYSEMALACITIGGMLIVSGILIIKMRKNEK